MRNFFLDSITIGLVVAGLCAGPTSAHAYGGVYVSRIGATASCPSFVKAGTRVSASGSYSFTVVNESDADARITVTVEVRDSAGNHAMDSSSLVVPAGRTVRQSIPEQFIYASHSSGNRIEATASISISGAASESASRTCSFRVD